ncbi:cupin domain-containing protein [Streptomyces sp. NBC_00536]|uniref:cupin domain-containing protein n=1 Tax=Streptomyces sp. NBC_00536 TaxID=2975769 RepID=UPI002E809E68|nr:cupin domain-containing protein [Streptomyces sp. NBC_00536]WUC84002.1 cupin domain-containing protein [Streptomyces sp. NBC_00536]
MSPMDATNLLDAATDLPDAWSSRVVGQVGTARVKVLRMDGLPVEVERHDAPEALLVLDGHLALEVDGRPVPVEAGEVYVVPAGTPHAVRPGSRGTLVIVETDGPASPGADSAR